MVVNGIFIVLMTGINQVPERGSKKVWKKVCCLYSESPAEYLSCNLNRLEINLLCTHFCDFLVHINYLAL